MERETSTDFATAVGPRIASINYPYSNTSMTSRKKHLSWFEIPQKNRFSQRAVFGAVMEICLAPFILILLRENSLPEREVKADSAEFAFNMKWVRK